MTNLQCNKCGYPYRDFVTEYRADELAQLIGDAHA